MAASASAVAERTSSCSRKRRRPAWVTIVPVVVIAVVIVLLQLDDIRSYAYANATGNGRRKNSNRHGHFSGANEGGKLKGRNYTRSMYEREMNAVIRNILAPANEEFGSYQQPGYPQGLSMMNRDMLRGLKRQVEAVVEAGIDGDVYEFGSWRGGASILMARVFDAYERCRLGGEGSSFPNDYKTRRMFYVFDTFDGFLDQQVSNDTLLQELLLDKYYIGWHHWTMCRDPLSNLPRKALSTPMSVLCQVCLRTPYPPLLQMVSTRVALLCFVSMEICTSLLESF